MFISVTFSCILLSLGVVSINQCVIAGKRVLHTCIIVRIVVGCLLFVSSDRSFMVDPLSYFSFQPVLHNWCNKGCGMCYPVCGMMHIKEPLLLIRKSSPCGGSRFPLSRYLSGPLPYD